MVENDTCKVLWDFTIQTDHVIEARRPGLILIKKEENNCTIVDFAIPYDTRIEQKEKEKVEKYQDLKREIMEYESKSSTHSHWGIRNTTKRHQEESRRTGN